MIITKNDTEQTTTSSLLIVIISLLLICSWEATRISGYPCGSIFASSTGISSISGAPLESYLPH